MNVKEILGILDHRRNGSFLFAVHPAYPLAEGPGDKGLSI
jgi:hypothetical protein